MAKDGETATEVWGLHDAIEFLTELEYDLSPLGNEEIFQLLENVLSQLNGNQDEDDTL